MKKQIILKSVIGLLMLCQMMVCCAQSQLSISYKGQCISMQNFPSVMTKIYNQETKDYHWGVEKNTILDVCEVVFQENGYVLMVAYGREDSLNVSYAIPMTLKKECFQIAENPVTSCVCYSKCQDGCKPVYKGGYEWESMELFSENVETPCVKKVIAHLPKRKNKRF